MPECRPLPKNETSQGTTCSDSEGMPPTKPARRPLRPSTFQIRSQGFPQHGVRSKVVRIVFAAWRVSTLVKTGAESLPRAPHLYSSLPRAPHLRQSFLVRSAAPRLASASFLADAADAVPLACAPASSRRSRQDASTLLFTLHRPCTVDAATSERCRRAPVSPFGDGAKRAKGKVHTSVSRPRLSRSRSARECPSACDRLSSGLSGESETKPIAALVLDACPEGARLAAWPGPCVTSCTVVHRPVG